MAFDILSYLCLDYESEINAPIGVHHLTSGVRDQGPTIIYNVDSNMSKAKESVDALEDHNLAST